MNKKQLKSIVKYIRPIFKTYNKIGSAGLSIIKPFIKEDDKLILFISYGGQKYDDSPKAIYEKMLLDSRFNNYKKVWALDNPERYPYLTSTVKTDTLAYFKTALSARVWITNSTVERGLNFTGKNNLYFDTWHGTPIKLMGSDIADGNKSFNVSSSKSTESPIDVMMAQSRYEMEIFSRTFHIPTEKFLLVGLPRNDELSNYTEDKRNEYRKKIGIPPNKKAVLYMPTFREFAKGRDQEIIAIPPLDLKKWEHRLGDEYVFLFRAHYEVAKVMNLEENFFVKDMTSYPTLNELLIASDLLISDYSSTYFDYSIMDKPMLHFSYDYDEYSKQRGMYFDIREELDGADNENDLIDFIISMNYSEEVKKTIDFRNKYLNYYGHATEGALDCIYAHIDQQRRQN